MLRTDKHVTHVVFINDFRAQNHYIYILVQQFIPAWHNCADFKNLLLCDNGFCSCSDRRICIISITELFVSCCFENSYYSADLQTYFTADKCYSNPKNSLTV